MMMPYHFLSGIYKLPPSEYKKFEETGSYIKIIPYYNNKYYTEREIIYTENFYKAYEFNLNKRGGSSGKISFNIPLDNININDKVEYFLNGTKKFVGYIESIDNSGLNVTVIPIWGRLIHQYIQGDLILESTKGVLDIVLSLREKIEEMGIIFDEKNIDLNNDKQITISFSGKNVSDILDEVEENISKSYSWGVDINNTFYFKEFSNISTKKLNWHNNHFSESEYTEDSSDLVSRYIIKVKDSITDENGDKNTYTFNIKRLDVGEAKYVKESDSTAKNIEVIGQKFTYNVKKKSYTLVVSGNVTKLDINVTPNYEKATVNISGNNNLKNKSRIVIKVTSEDGTSETKYYITINKKFDIVENKDLIITIIVGVLVVSLIIAILVTNNKKNKKVTTVVQE